jgi:hypothetical protein
MSETPEMESRVAKLQRDVEEIKEELQDTWHDRRDKYLDLVKKVLEDNPNATRLFLEIDGFRSVKEIEIAITSTGKRIPHVTLWRASKDLEKGGLVKKIGIKDQSPIFTKRPWCLDRTSYASVTTVCACSCMNCSR